jgi:GNAT superfamily N-acetyltransferase
MSGWIGPPPISPTGRDVNFAFHPVTPDRLGDLQRFAARNGKFRYCACMRWRLAGTDFARSTKEERMAEFENRIRRGVPVGVLAYLEGEPVGWCSIAPRETYVALERAKKLARPDAVPVWSVVCFFVEARARRAGLTRGLLEAAVAYARACGAETVEGYPVAPGSTSYTYMGSPATFRAAGFHDATPRGRERALVRRPLHPRARMPRWPGLALTY